MPANSRDSGAWWAAVYGVAQSRTRLKRLSSSSTSLSSKNATKEIRQLNRHLSEAAPWPVKAAEFCSFKLNLSKPQSWSWSRRASAE